MTASKHFAIHCSILAASILATFAPAPEGLHAQAAITLRDIPAPAGYTADMNEAGTVVLWKPGSPDVFTWSAAAGFQDLGLVGEGMGGIAINNLGHVVAYNDDGTRNNALLWTAASGWQALSATAADGTVDRMVMPTDINDNDAVVGFFASSRYGVLRNGVATYLPSNCVAYAISNSGVVVGYCYPIEGGPVSVTSLKGFILDPVTGMRIIDGIPHAINNKGQVAGVIPFSFTMQHAFFYDPAVGTMVDLGALGGYYDESQDSYVEMSSAASINDLGQVVGITTQSDRTQRTFVWDAATGMKVLLPDSYGNSTVRSINNRGEVVGQYYGGGEVADYFATVALPVPATPTAQTQAVENAVNALVTSGVLTTSSASQITTSLDAAVASLAKGNTGAAKNQINAASNKVNALVNSHKLSAADGKKLTDSLAAIAAGI